jgi:hypothetical protein
MKLDIDKILKLTFSKQNVFKNKPSIQIYGYIAHVTF